MKTRFKIIIAILALGLMAAVTPMTISKVQGLQAALDAKVALSVADARYPAKRDTVTLTTYFYKKTEIDPKTSVTFTITCDPAAYPTPTDGITLYYGSMMAAGMSTGAATRQKTVPFNCTLVGYSLATRSTAAASNETSSVYVRVNNTTDVLLSNAVTFAVGGGSFVNYFSSGALNTNLTAGDKLECKFVGATWATDPSSIYLSTTLYFKSR